MAPAFDSPKASPRTSRPAVVTRPALLVGLGVLALVLALMAWFSSRTGGERDPNFQPF